MQNSSHLIRLPYTPDLTEGGIVYALRTLSNSFERSGVKPYDRIRRVVAEAAVELAFRRYLSQQEIPFDVIGASPFTDPDKYNVSLGGHRCDIKSFLISHRDQIAQIRTDPSIILDTPALVPSDYHNMDGYTDHEARGFSTRVENLPAQKRVTFENPFYSVTSIHIKNIPTARLGIHSAVYKVAHIISPPDRGKHSGVWMDHTLAGYISRAEFRQRARLVAPNSRMFQYDHTKTKNLAVTVSSLHPLQDLFTRVREWKSV